MAPDTRISERRSGRSSDLGLPKGPLRRGGESTDQLDQLTI